jgi:hypothetical protein
MLRRLIRGLALCGCAMAAGCGVSASGTGLTAGFAEAAKDAHRYMKSDLIPGIGTARFPSAYAVSRTKVRIAQTKVAGNADQGVWLLLTMVNVKSNESNGAGELAEVTGMQQSPAVREAALDVANERDSCMSEVDSWLSGTSSLVASLNARPCLQQARLALAVLNKK